MPSAAAIGDDARMLTMLVAGLLVIAPAEFHPALREYIAAVAAERPVTLVALEDVLCEQEGADDPEKLKRFLFKAWRAGRCSHVLLVGDADCMPMRFMVLDRATPAAWNRAFYPSDLYYADVARSDGSFDDWNASREGWHAGYFGEVCGEHEKQGPINRDAVDYVPELALGRWPVSNMDEVRLVAAKTLRHRRQAREQKARHATLIAVGGWVENRPAMDALSGTLARRFKIERHYWKGAGRDDGTALPSVAATLASFASGAGLFLHSGHGHDDGWDQALDSNAIARIDNAATPAVIMSAGCSTARCVTLPPYEPYVDVDGIEHRGTNAGEVFTTAPPPPRPYQCGAHNPSGLGEKLLRKGPTGAVAYIGCSTGSQPCALTLQAAFAEAAGRVTDATGLKTTVGSAWRDALAAYVQREKLRELVPTESWYPASIYFQGMKFILLGDPSAPL